MLDDINGGITKYSKTTSPLFESEKQTSVAKNAREYKAAASTSMRNTEGPLIERSVQRSNIQMRYASNPGYFSG
jgi:hypothetical protein